MTRVVHLFVVVLLILAGCEVLGPGLRSDSGEQIWIARYVAGGKQCRDTGFVPPDLAALLEENDVSVFQESVVPMPVCEACEVCPIYAARHYYLIREDDLDIAEGLGFERSEAPPEF